MSGDIFGNLREWGHVPEQIAELIETGNLDEHQPGLVRILRYRDNWRLRETVLKAVGVLRAPSSELLSEIVSIAGDDGVYCEARILAVEALEHLITRTDTEHQDDCCTLRRRVAEGLGTLLDSPGPPVLHDTLRKCLIGIHNAQ